MEMRLQKFLADCGVASRRKAEELIAAGRVSVNGEVISGQGVKVDSQRDIVTVDGEAVRPVHKHTYILLNKPEGYICTVDDQFGRPTVIDLVKDIDARLYPVGRLDYDTSGLLILTDDGRLTHRLTHPSHSVEKTYIATVKGIPTEQELDILRAGIIIDGYKTHPAKLEIVEARKGVAVVKIIISEGRNRQVRKMLAHIGHDVTALRRAAIGELSLGRLEKGKYRHLTLREIQYLQNC